jgi:hypothetical protein
MSLRRETRTTLPAEPLWRIELHSPAYETGASPKHASRAKWLFEDPTCVVDNGARSIYSTSLLPSDLQTSEQLGAPCENWTRVSGLEDQCPTTRPMVHTFSLLDCL